MSGRSGLCIGGPLDGLMVLRGDDQTAMCGMGGNGVMTYVWREFPGALAEKTVGYWIPDSLIPEEEGHRAVRKVLKGAGFKDDRMVAIATLVDNAIAQIRWAHQRDIVKIANALGQNWVAPDLVRDSGVADHLVNIIKDEWQRKPMSTAELMRDTTWSSGGTLQPGDEVDISGSELAKHMMTDRVVVNGPKAPPMFKSAEIDISDMSPEALDRLHKDLGEKCAELTLVFHSPTHADLKKRLRLIEEKLEQLMAAADARSE